MATQAIDSKSSFGHPAGYDTAHLYHNVHPWQRLKGMMRAEKRDIWIAVIYSLVIGLVSLIVPVAVQAVVNTVAFGTLLQPLAILTILVFVGLAFVAILQAFRTFVVEMIQRRLFVRAAGDVTLRLVNVRSDAFDRVHGPELVNRFLEIVTVQKAAASLLVDGLSVVTSALIGMILLAIYHPWLLAYDVLLLVSMLIILFPLGRGAIPTSVKESKAKYKLVAWMQEVARHQISFKTQAGSTLAMDKADELVAEYLGYRSKHFKIVLRQIVGSFLMQAIASATLLGVGGWLVIDRQLTLGQLVAAELVVALVVSSFTKFGKHLETFYDLMAATDKLGYLMDLPTERTGGFIAPSSNSGAALRLEDLTLRSDAARKPLLEGVSLAVEPGSRIGLLGYTGSGKSTLLDIVYGLRQPDEGLIEFDGRDYREVRLNDLRAQIALVRDPEIFEGTVIDNLRLGMADCDPLDAREALDRVGLGEVVTRLPEGINTQLATGGYPLSPGQAVQLAIARALVHKPRLLILDEVLDSVDDLPERESLIETLFSKNSPWTLLIASQKPDILARCKSVVEIRDRRLEFVK
jgi:ABC-type bacteriocin/lantibiotic exporter with double-glycine peptidase domain